MCTGLYNGIVARIKIGWKVVLAEFILVIEKPYFFLFFHEAFNFIFLFSAVEGILHKGCRFLNIGNLQLLPLSQYILATASSHSFQYPLIKDMKL